MVVNVLSKIVPHDANGCNENESTNFKLRYHRIKRLKYGKNVNKHDMFKEVGSFRVSLIPIFSCTYYFDFRDPTLTRLNACFYKLLSQSQRKSLTDIKLSYWLRLQTDSIGYN